MNYLSAVSELSERYDAFILDLWGVIHDGQHLYPGAKDCLERLHLEGKKSVLLSNAPRRAHMAEAALLRMGVPQDCYVSVLTSGEAAYHCLAARNDPYFTPTGNGYLYIGLEKDRTLLEGLDYREVSDAAQAHFLILSHTYYDHQPMSELDALLGACLEKKLPALCVNPDMEVVRQTGERVECAGHLAAEYARRGGKVIYFGKPHAVAYRHALAALGDIDRKKILAVGDTLATDIRGAVSQGLASALVTGGVLKSEVGGPAEPEYQAKCAAVFARTGFAPDYILPAFNW